MKKFKKALRGYSPAAVRQIIQESQENHRIRMEELREQAKLLETEQIRLTTELERLTEAERNQPTVLSDQAAAKKLLEAHLKQTEAVWQVLQELKSQEDRMQAESADKQAERDRMLGHVEKKLKEMLNDLTERRE